jgi:sulfur carrier protein
VNVTVNGRDTTVEPGTTVGDVVASFGGGEPRFGVAVARNGEVVARSTWQTTSLMDGDSIELLGAMQGG